jgi:hypothetical protein
MAFITRICPPRTAPNTSLIGFILALLLPRIRHRKGNCEHGIVKPIMMVVSLEVWWAERKYLTTVV